MSLSQREIDRVAGYITSSTEDLVRALKDAQERADTLETERDRLKEQVEELERKLEEAEARSQ